MEQKELVGKRVLVSLDALPREMQEQRVTEPVFDRFSIVEVVGYVSSNTHTPGYHRRQVHRVEELRFKRYGHNNEEGRNVLACEFR